MSIFSWLRKSFIRTRRLVPILGNGPDSQRLAGLVESRALFAGLAAGSNSVRKRTFLTLESLEDRLAPATFTSVASGNWNADATWSGSGTPGASDTVIIDGAFTVTVNV